MNTASASGPNYNAGAPAAEREMLTNPATGKRHQKCEQHLNSCISLFDMD